MENFEKIPNRENKKNGYEFLKGALLNSSISFGDVLNKLFKLDQSTPSRDASEENLKLLYDPKIVDYVIQHPEDIEPYHGFLSFTEFHVAQRIASSNPQEAIDHFRKALKSARIDKSNESWAAYAWGTLLYMEGKEIPEEIIAKVGKSRNAEILRNFNAGLRKRGAPSYDEDYYRNC